jgi:outer membrane protein
MNRVTSKLLLAVAAACLLTAGVFAGAQEKIGVVDMQRAIVGSADGKKAEVNFTAKLEQFRKDIEAKQKHIEDQQNKLKTQDKVLSDAVKATITKDVEKSQTELTRAQEDAQKELDALRDELMRPIAQVAQAVLSNYAQQHGFTLIIDSSNPQNNSIVYVDEKNADLTNEMIKLIDAELAKNAQAAKKPPQK